MITDRTNRIYWQRMARLYAPFMRSSDTLYEMIAERCRIHLTSEMNVLELACGSGQLTYRLAGFTHHWDATDYSDNMIKEAQKVAQPCNLSFSVRDATRLPYGDEMYDAVLIANALHIMPAPGLAMAEIHRVLKPGGILMAPTFIWGKAVRQNAAAWVLEKTGFHVFHRWNADEFPLFIESHGFSVLDNVILGSRVRPLCCLIAKKNTDC